MSTVKERIVRLVQEQPEDASFDDVLRELAFARLVESGLEDVRTGRTLPHAVVAERVRQWPN